MLSEGNPSRKSGWSRSSREVVQVLSLCGLIGFVCLNKKWKSLVAVSSDDCRLESLAEVGFCRDLQG